MTGVKILFMKLEEAAKDTLMCSLFNLSVVQVLMGLVRLCMCVVT